MSEPPHPGTCICDKCMDKIEGYPEDYSPSYYGLLGQFHDENTSYFGYRRNKKRYWKENEVGKKEWIEAAIEEWNTWDWSPLPKGMMKFPAMCKDPNYIFDWFEIYGDGDDVFLSFRDAMSIQGKKPGTPEYLEWEKFWDDWVDVLTLDHPLHPHAFWRGAPNASFYFAMQSEYRSRIGYVRTIIEICKSEPKSRNQLYFLVPKSGLLTIYDPQDPDDKKHQKIVDLFVDFLVGNDILTENNLKYSTIVENLYSDI